MCKLWLVWYVVAIDAFLSWLLVVVVIGVVVVASLIVGIAAVVGILCGECYVIVFLLRPYCFVGGNVNPMSVGCGRCL